jgi:hypothetical protein
LENVRLLAEIQQKTQQVEQLQIEIDEVLRKKAVTEIVSTDYFQDIELKAKQMRERKAARRESQGASSLYARVGSPSPSEARPSDS